MRLLPIIVIGTVVLFFIGLIAPRRSKGLERWIDTRMRKGRRKGNRNAGWLGDTTAKSLKFGQRLADGALAVGRRVRDWLPV
jgi:hypothetical protein